MQSKESPDLKPQDNVSNQTKLRHLTAPCGLDCSRCLNCAEGSVAGHARAIAKTMGDNFQTYADRLKNINPAMNNYSGFRSLLDSLASPKCDGCRSENRTCLPSCKVAECVQKQDIEFCFECTEFPDCGKTGLTDTLLERWEKNNKLIKSIGIGKYLTVSAEKPRYP